MMTSEERPKGWQRLRVLVEEEPVGACPIVQFDQACLYKINEDILYGTGTWWVVAHVAAGSRVAQKLPDELNDMMAGELQARLRLPPKLQFMSRYRKLRAKAYLVDNPTESFSLPPEGMVGFCVRVDLPEVKEEVQHKEMMLLDPHARCIRQQMATVHRLAFDVVRVIPELEELLMGPRMRAPRVIEI